MRSIRIARFSFASLSLSMICLVCLPGCAGLASHMVYWVKGHKVDAKCNALDEQRVAVVCVTGERVEGFGLSGEGEALSRGVASILSKKVRKIEIVRPEEVADWRDTNSWDEIDYRTIGRGLKADMVVAIDLSSFSLHDNSTLLRGKAGIRTTVYDIKNGGKVVFREDHKEFAFPENGGRHSVENETNFHRNFLMLLSQDIAKNFYAYDTVEDVAKDATFLGQ